jgi:micrococcal nuclease
MSRRYRRRPTLSTAVVLLIVVLAIFRAWQAAQDTPAPAALSEGTHTVERVVDGDTLLLTNQARVRLQGVDTPETVQPNHPVEPWGPESSEFTRQFIGDGRVRLQFDLERKDRYGRFLAYVYKGDRMLNEELLRAGLARAQLQYRYSDAMKRRFREAEQEARDARRGIWSELAEPEANRAVLPLPVGEGMHQVGSAVRTNCLRWHRHSCLCYLAIRRMVRTADPTLLARVQPVSGAV